MIKIPNETKQFKQTNVSDRLGNIWSSMNLDLTENIGTVRVSGRGMIVDSNADLANLETPVSFAFYDNGSAERIWCIAGARMFYNSGDPDDSFTQDATASTPTTLTDECDMEVFNNALYVVGDGNLYKYTGSWSTPATSPNGGNASCCVYAGRFYFSQSSSQVASFSSADDTTIAEPSGTTNTTLYTLNLANFGAGSSSANTITSIKSSSNRIWIATIDATSQAKNGGRYGKIFEWDGVSTQANAVYHLASAGAMALIIKDDVPYAVDAIGRLLKYDGQDFVEVARLPIGNTRYLRNPMGGTTTQRFIHPRGMAVRNGKILMFINNQFEDSTNSIKENLPSGVWEYDENIGLYHKYSLSLWDETVSSTRTDFSQNRIVEAGALFYYRTMDDTASTDGDLLIGASYFTSATGEAYGIFCNNSLRENVSKMGYLVTTKIEAEYITDLWQRTYLKYKKLLDSSDKIVIKYRTSEVQPIEGTITWTSTTTFTSTLDLSTIAVGDEFEGTAGTGSGQIEHITAISESAGTYTVTLENAVTGATGTAKGRFQKWIKLGTIQDQTTQYKAFNFPLNANSTWIQLKVVMYFTGNDELEEISLLKEPYLKS
jgi:hypothetical protein